MKAPGLSFSLRASRGDFALVVSEVLATGVLCVLGPNGAGKTTLLRALLGAFPLAEGSVEVDGVLLEDTRARVRVATEDRRLSYVPQGYGLFPHFTVAQNLTFALGCREPSSLDARKKDRFEVAVDRFGLATLLGRRPAGLSGGEKQRVALARALALEPRALLLDEPLAALDPVSRDETRGELKAALDELGLPTLVVTHDPTDARVLGERALVLESGRMTQLGTAEELERAPTTPFVAAFFGRPRAAVSSGSKGFRP